MERNRSVQRSLPLVELQLATGMRPDEVTIMRPCDIGDTGNIWTYIPESQKMDHKNLDRLVLLGPKAQQLLRPRMDRDTDAYFFSPREAYEEAIARRRKDPSRANRIRKKPYPRMPRDHYDDETYCQAVERACLKAWVPKWTPGQLRHSTAAKIRRKYGLEAARVVLGHRSVSTTEIYAEKDMAEALRIIGDLG